MSKKYKNAMNKITVDEQMKNRILKNINKDEEIEVNKYLKSKNIKIVKHTYYRNLGVIAACCVVIIYILNNKYILNSYKLNRNSIQNIEIAFNESENNNETSKSRERIEADLKNNERSLDKVSDTSENSRSVDDGTLNSNIINKNNYGNENSQNNISKNEDKIAEASYTGRSTVKEFKTLDELKKSIDFKIKTPKVQSESNEIKSIIMDSNQNISIEYESKDYSVTFKIKKEANEENSYNIQIERETVMNINEKSVLLRGNSNLINIASWREDNLYFEIESITGIKEEKIINIIKSIK